MSVGKRARGRGSMQTPQLSVFPAPDVVDSGDACSAKGAGAAPGAPSGDGDGPGERERDGAAQRPAARLQLPGASQPAASRAARARRVTRSTGGAGARVPLVPGEGRSVSR